MLKFSYIVPTYNRFDNLKETVTSILNQDTKETFEIIIVDDGSTDNTSDIENHFQDSRVTYIYQENSGVSVARNTGFKYSKGKFVIFLDSDDLVTNNQMEIFSDSILNNPFYHIYFTSYSYWNSNTQEKKPRKKIQYGDYNEFFINCIAGIQPCFSGCVCINRNILNKKEFIFEPQCNFGEDQKLWVDIFYHYKCFSIPIITMQYRVDSGGSLSKQKITRLPPDIKFALDINHNDSNAYSLHRLAAFTIIAFKDFNGPLFREIIAFCFTKKIMCSYLKALFLHIKNKFFFHKKSQ